MLKEILLSLIIFSNVFIAASNVGAETVAQAPVNVGNKICPVSGEEIGDAIGMEVITYEYQGKIYNLCCASCIEEFKSNPEKYVQIALQATKNNK